MAASIKPLCATLSALSYCFAPRYLESRALIPTAVPIPNATLRFWNGKQYETAVSESVL